mgnify:CR=1 FL=1|jgi:hypothetical protein|tara:strand:- start:1749 stop:2024 length:276 start_codon:yes stop_codon:yes gene_type:complete
MKIRFDTEKFKRESFKEVFGTEEGKNVLALLAKSHFVYRTSHSDDPYKSAWQEGQRTVVMEIINLVGADIEAIRKRIDMQETARMQLMQRA